MKRFLSLALLALWACAPSPQAVRDTLADVHFPSAVTESITLHNFTPDIATWPEGFEEAAGPRLSNHVQMVLVDAHNWGFWPQEYEVLEAMQAEHPEWNEFIEYVQLLRWEY